MTCIIINGKKINSFEDARNAIQKSEDEAIKNLLSIKPTTLTNNEVADIIFNIGTSKNYAFYKNATRYLQNNTAAYNPKFRNAVELVVSMHTGYNIDTNDVDRIVQAYADNLQHVNDVGVFSFDNNGIPSMNKKVRIDLTKIKTFASMVLNPSTPVDNVFRDNKIENTRTNHRIKTITFSPLKSRYEQKYAILDNDKQEILDTLKSYFLNIQDNFKKTSKSIISKKDILDAVKFNFLQNSYKRFVVKEITDEKHHLIHNRVKADTGVFNSINTKPEIYIPYLLKFFEIRATSPELLEKIEGTNFMKFKTPDSNTPIESVAIEIDPDTIEFYQNFFNTWDNLEDATTGNIENYGWKSEVELLIQELGIKLKSTTLQKDLSDADSITDDEDAIADYSVNDAVLEKIWGQQAFHTPLKKSLSSNVKRVLTMIPAVDIKGNDMTTTYGAVKYMPMDEVYSDLVLLLVDKDPSEYIDIIKEATVIKPYLKSVVNIISNQSSQTIAEFHTTFRSTYLNFVTLIQDYQWKEEPNKYKPDEPILIKRLRSKYVNSNNKNLSSKLIKIWQKNAVDSTNQDDSKLYKLTTGAVSKKEARPQNVTKLLNELDKLNKDSTTILNGSYSDSSKRVIASSLHKVFTSIGTDITFDETLNILRGTFKIKGKELSEKKLLRHILGVDGQGILSLKESFITTNPLSNEEVVNNNPGFIYDFQNNQWSGVLKGIAQMLEVVRTDKYLSFIDHQGKSRYPAQNPTTLSEVIRLLKNTPAEDIKKLPFIAHNEKLADSFIINLLSKQPVLDYLTNEDFESVKYIGESTSRQGFGDLSPANDWVNRLNGFLDNRFTLFTQGDRSRLPMLRLPNFRNTGVKSLKNIFSSKTYKDKKHSKAVEGSLLTSNIVRSSRNTPYSRGYLNSIMRQELNSIKKAKTDIEPLKVYLMKYYPDSYESVLKKLTISEHIKPNTVFIYNKVEYTSDQLITMLNTHGDGEHYRYNGKGDNDYRDYTAGRKLKITQFANYFPETVTANINGIETTVKIEDVDLSKMNESDINSKILDVLTVNFEEDVIKQRNELFKVHQDDTDPDSAFSWVASGKLVDDGIITLDPVSNKYFVNSRNQYFGDKRTEYNYPTTVETFKTNLNVDGLLKMYNNDTMGEGFLIDDKNSNGIVDKHEIHHLNIINTLQTLAEDYVIHKLIYNNELRKLFGVSDDMYKSHENFSKRAGLLTTPGREPVFANIITNFKNRDGQSKNEFYYDPITTDDNHKTSYGILDTYTTAFIRDFYSTKQEDTLIEILNTLDKSGIVKEAYEKGNSNKTDGQGVVSIHGWRRFLMGFVEWDMHYENAYHNYLRIGEFKSIEWTDELMREAKNRNGLPLRAKEALNNAHRSKDNPYPIVVPMKYYHDEYKVVTNPITKQKRTVRISIKNSYFVMLKSFTKNYPLFDDLRRRMENSTIETVHYDIDTGSIVPESSTNTKSITYPDYSNLSTFGKTDVINFESASKIANFNVHKLDNSKESGEGLKLKLPITLSSANVRQVQIIPHKAGKNGDKSQQRTIIPSELKFEKNYLITTGYGANDEPIQKSLTGRQVYDLYHIGLVSKIVKSNKNLLKKLKLDKVIEIEKELFHKPKNLLEKRDRLEVRRLELNNESEVDKKSIEDIEKELNIINTELNRLSKNKINNYHRYSDAVLNFRIALRDIRTQSNNDRGLSENYNQKNNIIPVNAPVYWAYEVADAFPVFRKTTEQGDISLWKNNVLTQTIKGDSAVQVAEIGGHVTRGDLKFIHGDLSEIKKKDFKERKPVAVGDTLYNDLNGRLEYVYEITNDSYKTYLVEAAEVILSYDMAKKYGITPGNVKKLPKKLRTILGFRIPTQDKSSILPMIIVDVLPKNYKSTIIVPGEITTQQGSDFDVDKLFLATYNYNVVNKYENIYKHVEKNLLDKGVNASSFDNNKDEIILMITSIEQGTTLPINDVNIKDAYIDGIEEYYNDMSNGEYNSDMIELADFDYSNIDSNDDTLLEVGKYIRIPKVHTLIVTVNKTVTLSSFATKYKKSVDEIVNANPSLKDEDMIIRGTDVSIPDVKLHIVKDKNESLSSIANEYGISVEDIKKINYIPTISYYDVDSQSVEQIENMLIDLRLGILQSHHHLLSVVTPLDSPTVGTTAMKLQAAEYSNKKLKGSDNTLVEELNSLIKIANEKSADKKIPSYTVDNFIAAIFKVNNFNTAENHESYPLSGLKNELGIINNILFGRIESNSIFTESIMAARNKDGGAKIGLTANEGKGLTIGQYLGFKLADKFAIKLKIDDENLSLTNLYALDNIDFVAESEGASASFSASEMVSSAVDNANSPWMTFMTDSPFTSYAATMLRSPGVGNFIPFLVTHQPIMRELNIEYVNGGYNIGNVKKVIEVVGKRYDERFKIPSVKDFKGFKILDPIALHKNINKSVEDIQKNQTDLLMDFYFYTVIGHHITKINKVLSSDRLSNTIQISDIAARANLVDEMTNTSDVNSFIVADDSVERLNGPGGVTGAIDYGVYPMSKAFHDNVIESFINDYVKSSIGVSNYPIFDQTFTKVKDVLKEKIQITSLTSKQEEKLIDSLLQWFMTNTSKNSPLHNNFNIDYVKSRFFKFITDDDNNPILDQVNDVDLLADFVYETTPRPNPNNIVEKLRSVKLKYPDLNSLFLNLLEEADEAYNTKSTLRLLSFDRNRDLSKTEINQLIDSINGLIYHDDKEIRDLIEDIFNMNILMSGFGLSPNTFLDYFPISYFTNKGLSKYFYNDYEFFTTDITGINDYDFYDEFIERFLNTHMKIELLPTISLRTGSEETVEYMTLKPEDHENLSNHNKEFVEYFKQLNYRERAYNLYKRIGGIKSYKYKLVEPLSIYDFSIKDKNGRLINKSISKIHKPSDNDDDSTVVIDFTKIDLPKSVSEITANVDGMVDNDRRGDSASAVWEDIILDKNGKVVIHSFDTITPGSLSGKTIVDFMMTMVQNQDITKTEQDYIDANTSRIKNGDRTLQPVNLKNQVSKFNKNIFPDITYNNKNVNSSVLSAIGSDVEGDLLKGTLQYRNSVKSLNKKIENAYGENSSFLLNVRTLVDANDLYTLLLYTRSIQQINKSDAVYVIGNIDHNSNTVRGINSVMVEYALQKNLPVYAYDTEFKHWYVQDNAATHLIKGSNGKFQKLNTIPRLTKNPALLGNVINTNERNMIKSMIDIVSIPPVGKTEKVVETSQQIYENLGSKTKSVNVTIDNVKGRQKSTKAGVVAYRTQGNNFLKAFNEDRTIGNPWNSKGYGLYKSSSVKDSVVQFTSWLIGENHVDKLQEYRKAIIDNIPNMKGMNIVYYSDLKEPSHATALDYLINKYDWNNANTVLMGNNSITSQKTSVVKGINIRTDKNNPNSLGNRLTNPNWYAKNLMDVEKPYKEGASRKTAPQLNANDALKYDMNLMYKLQVQKFKQNPELIDEINQQGGLDFITSSSHIIGVKNSRWEGKGLESNFIKVLSKSYEKVAKELGKFKTSVQNLEKSNNQKIIKNTDGLIIIENAITKKQSLDIINNAVDHIEKTSYKQTKGSVSWDYGYRWTRLNDNMSSSIKKGFVIGKQLNGKSITTQMISRWVNGETMNQIGGFPLYGYTNLDVNGNALPKIPENIIKMLADKGIDISEYEVSYNSVYDKKDNGSLIIHQDNTETNTSPIITISLGRPMKFITYELKDSNDFSLVDNYSTQYRIALNYVTKNLGRKVKYGDITPSNILEYAETINQKAVGLVEAMLKDTFKDGVKTEYTLSNGTILVFSNENRNVLHEIVFDDNTNSIPMPDGFPALKINKAYKGLGHKDRLVATNDYRIVLTLRKIKGIKRIDSVKNIKLDLIPATFITPRTETFKGDLNTVNPDHVTVNPVNMAAGKFGYDTKENTSSFPLTTTFNSKPIKFLKRQHKVLIKKFYKDASDNPTKKFFINFTDSNPNVKIANLYTADELAQRFAVVNTEKPDNIIFNEDFNKLIEKYLPKKEVILEQIIPQNNIQNIITVNYVNDDNTVVFTDLETINIGDKVKTKDGKVYLVSKVITNPLEQSMFKSGMSRDVQKLNPLLVTYLGTVNSDNRFVMLNTDALEKFKLLNKLKSDTQKKVLEEGWSIEDIKTELNSLQIDCG